MKINTIFSFFTPKSTKFFSFLNEIAVILDHAGDLVIKLFSTIDENKEERDRICKLIKGEELKGDRITHQIFKTLNETFITPFDREDISTLTDKMDNAIDTINRSAHKVLMYAPEKLPNSTLLLAKIIKRGTFEVRDAISKLSNLKIEGQLIRRSYKAIETMEKEADVVYEKGIVELFRSETQTFEIMKLKEIIQELEKSTNKINSIGRTLKNIFIKYT